MIPPTFTIDVDPTRSFLHLTLVGDWNTAIMGHFEVAVADRIRGMIAGGMKPGTFLTLIDMSRKNVLPKDIATRMAGMLRPDSPSRRIALIVSGAIHLMQARRLCQSDSRRCFLSADEAREWLFAA